MYLFAVLLFSIFAFLEVFNKEFVGKYKPLFAFICYAFLIFHDGLRWETGTDWIPYYDAFETLFFNSDNSAAETFEPGYFAFFYAIRLLSDDYSLYLILHAIVFYTCFFYCIFKISRYPFVSLLLFYYITLPYLGMNRQFLAMAIYAVGLVQLSEGKKLHFFLAIIVAMLFHKTAIVGLAALFANHRIRPIFLIALLGVACAISFSGVLDGVSNLAALALSDGMEKKADVYLNEEYEISPIATAISLTRKLLWVGLLLVFDKKVDDKDDNYYFIFNLYFVGVLFYTLFNGTPLQVIVARALIYYNIMEMFLIPYILTIFKPNYGKLFVMFLLVAYCYINIKKGFSNYTDLFDLFEPYKGLFINTDYVRQTH